MQPLSEKVELNGEGICQIGDEKYPAVGFGTYPLKGETCFQAVTAAIEAGYRIIDTATFYENFEEIGRALKKYERAHFYLISKVWPTSHTRPLLEEDIRATLKRLQTDYLDAYFLHWPNSKVPIEETLSTLEEFRSSGLLRHIGLSNVTIHHLQRAFEVKVPISWIQVEMSPFFYDPELLAFCKKNNIGLQAWRPLGKGRASDDAMLIEQGKKYGKTPSQIAVRWAMQHHCLPLPGSKNIGHIQGNIHVMDFALSDADMQEIDERARHGERMRITLEDDMGFTDEFDFSYEQCWPK